MKQVYIVTCTKVKTKEEFAKRPLGKSLSKLEKIYSSNQLSYTVVYNNKEGLSVVYNRFLNNVEHEDKIIVFCHDDLILDTIFLCEHLNKSPYAVTGLAGACIFKNESNVPPAWHLMTERDSWFGEVKHIKDGVIFTTQFGKTIGRVKVIDGLFIAVDVNKIINTKARFNETYEFHHYDLAFCMECLKENITVGVMPINVIHYGLGDSMLTRDWEESARKFSNEYSNFSKYN
jgi:hypothetical protein